MNKSFVAVDRLNSVAFECNSLVRFDFKNVDYLVYYIPDTDSKCRIYTSRLVKDGSDKYTIIDISSEEKNVVNDITNSVVISFPSTYSKDVNLDEFVNDFCSKNDVIFSKAIPSLSEQTLYSNSFLANSSLEYIQYVKEFYNYVLPRVQIQPIKNSFVWSPPSSLESTDGKINAFSNTDVSEASNYANNGLYNQQLGLGNIESIIPINALATSSVSNTPDIQNNSVTDYRIMSPSDFQVVGDSSVNTSNFTNYGYNYPNNNMNMSTVNNYSNPNQFNNVLSSNFDVNYQYGNFNQDNNSGGSSPELQSTKVKTLKKNAGYASNRYIVIGTVCFIIASIIVATAIILVNNL